MQIVACQLDIAWEDKAGQPRSRVRAMLAGDARSNRARSSCCRKCSPRASACTSTRSPKPADGPTHAVSGRAGPGASGAVVLGGVVTRGADGRGRNEAVVFGPAGPGTGPLLQDAAVFVRRRNETLRGGRGYRHIPSGTISASRRSSATTCAFPSCFASAVRSGAELLVVIANWPQPREAHWLALLRARAIENQGYVVGVNRAGSDPHVRYRRPQPDRRSAGRNRWPRPERSPQVLVADIELAPLVEYRQQFPALADMRAELFARSEFVVFPRLNDDLGRICSAVFLSRRRA